ncbi:hypothetical protein Droror1_Dr00024282 [Drosera rotundifolia]
MYTRDTTRPVKYASNYDLYKSKATNWRDTLAINNLWSGDDVVPEMLPEVCRQSPVHAPSAVFDFQFSVFCF